MKVIGISLKHRVRGWLSMGKMKFGEKASNPFKTLGTLLKTVFKKRMYLLPILFILLVISCLAIVYSAQFIGEFIDGVVIPLKGVKNPDFTPAVKALFKFALVVLASIVSTFISEYIMVGVAQDAIYEIRIKMFDKLESLPLSYFDKNSRGTIMSRFANDTDNINQLISNTLISILSAVLTVVMVFVSMITTNWILTLVVIAYIFITLLVTKIVTKKSSKYYRSQQSDLADVNGYIEEMINGGKVVKVFNHEEKSKEEFSSLNEKLNTSMSHANAWAGSMGPINNNLGNLQYVTLVVAGSLIIIGTGGAYTVGGLAEFLQLSRSFSNHISQVMQNLNNILYALAGAERVFKFLEEKPEVDDGKVNIVRVKSHDELVKTSERTRFWAWEKDDGSLIPLKGGVVLKNVNFGYTPEKIVLHDISLYAKPGQKIAFVGSTGAGKTTIIALLTRFYNIESGSIELDGINIKDISLQSLRHSIGVVLQDTNLFTGTIMENLRYGRLEATDEDVIKAAKLANAHDFIMMMEDGYNTMITNNGENLSQGQRQLLSIARAAVEDPPILIMDEATSSIDTHTEALVQSGMDKLMENRTVFVIAHRLSTVRNSNAIMVLENGRIIERGDHDDLLKEKGVYYRLYTGEVELE